MSIMPPSERLVARGEGAEPNPDRFRKILGRVPTSVAVVSGLAPDGEPVGLAVGTLTSVSLDPPLIAFCAGRESTSWPRIRPGKRFCVNVLAQPQEPVSAVFASKQPDKFAEVEWSPSAHGIPMIHGVTAWIECVIDEEHEAGDHTIVLGRVERLEAGPGPSPLIFLGGRYGELR
ncbi:flavin reductase family protein [Streptomyces sp. JNUCC 63]